MKRQKIQKPLEDFFEKSKRKKIDLNVRETDVHENETFAQNSPTSSRLLEEQEGSQNIESVLNKPHLSKMKTDSPLQPVLEIYPSTNGRRFSLHWYKQHDWIEYSEREDSVYCFACRHFSENILLKGEKMGCRTFIDKGFKKWRDTKALLLQHSQSERHLSSMSAWGNFKRISDNKMLSIASELCTTRSNEIIENRKHIKTLFRIASFLGRQGLSFRGHCESSESSNRGNFIELIETMSEENDDLKAKMSRRYGHYTSHEYQNDIITVFGQKIKETIISEVKQAGYFSLLVDETKDCSKKEQMALILRYVHNGCIRERAVGAYHMKDLSAEALSKFIIELLTSYGLDFNFCVGQCYDGASVMSGWANGVQAKIKEIAPNACYIHCYAHRLNLVLIDTISNIPELKEFFSIVQNLYNFICNSNPRYQLFIECQKELGFQNILTLERNAVTRWFYWHRSLTKIIKAYEAIVMVLDLISDSHTEASAEAIGLQTKLKSRMHIVYLYILENILGLTYNLSEQLQSESMNLSKAASLISIVKDELNNARSDGEWSKLFKKSEDFAQRHNVSFQDSAYVKRKKKIPSKLQAFLFTSSIPQQDSEDLSFETEMKRRYFILVDRILAEFDKRFTSNQKLLQALQALDPENEFFLEPEKITIFLELYPNYFDEIYLSSQLRTAKKYVMDALSKGENYDVLTALNIFEKLPTAFSEVIKVLKVSLTLPISTASNERFFSVLKHVKTYIRSTISNERLDNLLLISVEKKLVKSFSLDELVDNFAKMRPRRFPLLD